MGLVSKEEIRNRIIRIIAATRFPFVDQTDWGEGYVTIVNDEVKRRGIEMLMIGLASSGVSTATGNDGYQVNSLPSLSK